MIKEIMIQILLNSIEIYCTIITRNVINVSIIIIQLLYK